MIAADVRGLRCGSRLTHRESGTPAVVEMIVVWGDGQIQLTVRFGGDPRTDPWGPFREAPACCSAVRDLERIVIGRAGLSEWEVAPSCDTPTGLIS